MKSTEEKKINAFSIYSSNCRCKLFFLIMHKDFDFLCFGLNGRISSSNPFIKVPLILWSVHRMKVVNGSRSSAQWYLFHSFLLLPVADVIQLQMHYCNVFRHLNKMTGQTKASLLEKYSIFWDSSWVDR